MPTKYLIINANIVNEGKVFKGDVLIDNGIISKIFHEEKEFFDYSTKKDVITIDAEGKYLLPGIIDDHVHFREPGLTHKGDIYSESKAAVAGGITSYMEMPNTVPNATTQELLEEKYKIASEKSLANYSFFLGATDNNIDEILKINPHDVCGIKVFMGASTGNMLVDNPLTLKDIFSLTKSLIAVHCEDEKIIKENTTYFKNKYGNNIPVVCHPLIRTDEACYKSSLTAVTLAKKYNTRLHLLHLTTAKEMELLDNSLSLEQKRITAEVCVHHLWFNDKNYKEKGTLIKWNPAIKSENNRQELFNALLDNRIDIVATDHAPHTLKEKTETYFKAPSGGPLIQHSLAAMLEFYHKGKISLGQIGDKMCHAPAICYQIEKRGFIREGFWADLILVDLNNPWEVNKSNILSKCMWSPFEYTIFLSKVTHTFVNGNLIYENGNFHEISKGKRLLFNR